MTTSINAQQANITQFRNNYFSACHSKMIHVAQATQNSAKTVFGFCTHPLVVYFVVSNLIFSYGASVSIPRVLFLNALSTLVAVPTAFGAVICRAKLQKECDPVSVVENVSATVAPVVAITKTNYQNEVLESKIPVILDAYATWCPPCKAVAPIFDDLSKELNGKIKFAKLNVDAEQSLAKKLEITSMPTFLFIKDGKIVERQIGALNKNDFVQRFVRHFL